MRGVDSILRSALLAVLDRDLDRAEELLGHAVRMDSHTVEPYLALARLYRMRGEIGRAICIHQNLLLRSDLTEDQKVAALAALATDFRQGGFLQRAIASYEEVVAHEPQHRRALRALIPLLSSVRRYRRAIELSRRLAKLEGRKAQAGESALLVEMARAAQAEGRNEDARRALKRALRKDPDAVQAWIALGAIEAERGKSKAALAAWARVPAIDRRSGPRVYSQLEATYAALERTREFEAYLRELLAERPDDVHARIALARSLAARGDGTAAVEELRQARERAPDNLEVRGALGRLPHGPDVSLGLQELPRPDAVQRPGRPARDARSRCEPSRAGERRVGPP